MRGAEGLQRGRQVTLGLSIAPILLRASHRRAASRHCRGQRWPKWSQTACEAKNRRLPRQSPGSALYWRGILPHKLSLNDFECQLCRSAGACVNVNHRPPRKTPPQREEERRPIKHGVVKFFGAENYLARNPIAVELSYDLIVATGVHIIKVVIEMRLSAMNGSCPRAAGVQQGF